MLRRLSLDMLSDQTWRLACAAQHELSVGAVACGGAVGCKRAIGARGQGHQGRRDRGRGIPRWKTKSRRANRGAVASEVRRRFINGGIIRFECFNYRARLRAGGDWQTRCNQHMSLFAYSVAAIGISSSGRLGNRGARRCEQQQERRLANAVARNQRVSAMLEQKKEHRED